MWPQTTRLFHRWRRTLSVSPRTKTSWPQRDWYIAESKQSVFIIGRQHCLGIQIVNNCLDNKLPVHKRLPKQDKEAVSMEHTSWLSQSYRILYPAKGYTVFKTHFKHRFAHFMRCCLRFLQKCIYICSWLKLRVNISYYFVVGANVS